ncbi:MAG: AgmX/PglI C-terminal domain-containing protein [Sorangiineae bacterium]|nr:AgmX/PglI C-terminal domain-containing protein [Polyangiaceae bacterium]MEB2320899.1 AgmX/PglI C-terminal domain-containing protein [Sorangiineae bacterium]
MNQRIKSAESRGAAAPHPETNLSLLAQLARDASNPFASPARSELRVADDAPEGTYTYAMVKSGPEVPSAEVEHADALAIDVRVSWGASVLGVAHLSPPRAYAVGEDQGEHTSADCFVPAERIGATRLPLVLADAAGARLVIPPRATGHVTLPGGPRMTAEAARALGAPSVEVSGGVELPLTLGARAHLELGGFVFQVGAVKAAKRSKRSLLSAIDRALASAFGASFVGAAAVVASMAAFVPPLGLTDDAGADQDRLYAIQQYLSSAAERERDAVKEESNADGPREETGGTGERAAKEEGKMGSTVSRETGKRWANAGPKDNPNPALSDRAALRQDAQSFGMIGLLSSGLAGDPNAPTSPFGRADALGTDPMSANGNMWGDELGESAGSGGLGLTGIGDGGGGYGVGVGLGDIGMGHGAGLGQGPGFGNSFGHFAKGHQTKAPRVGLVGATTVSGRLPPEVIQRTVRQNFGRFRMCYEQGLARNPNLEGRVAVRFVIGRDGAVSNVANGGSDLPDSGVVSCVVSAYYGLSFPAPEDGIVTVVYPISFSPG